MEATPAWITGDLAVLGKVTAPFSTRKGRPRWRNIRSTDSITTIAAAWFYVVRDLIAVTPA